MDKKLKARWLKALRSRKFKQAKSFLHVLGEKGEPDRFCCLGVLCKVANVSRVDIIEDEFTRSDGGVTRAVAYGFNDGDEDSGVLPVGFQEVVGITDEQQSRLAGMNDSGKKFGQIARWIERNL